MAGLSARSTWKEDPQTKATISWSTKSAGSSHTVYLSTKSQKGKLSGYKMKVKAEANGEFTGSKGTCFYHHARVKGLKPSTKYYFVMVSNKTVSKEYYFITAPDDDRTFTLLFGGDSRSGKSARQSVNKMMSGLQSKDKNLIALAHGGDFINSGRNWGQWNSWLSDNELLIAKDGRVLPIIPAKGNHDGGKIIFEVFDLVGKPFYFTTQLSGNATLITLDTNISGGGNQAQFLKTELEKNKGSKWLLAQYHRPLYPAVKSPAKHKVFWCPLFEKYNLDVGLEADGHNIKRTVPIRKDKHDPKGVVYVGEGGLGVGQRTPKKDRWYLKSPGMADKGHHVMILEFNKKNTIDYQVMLLNGKIRDRYTFKPKKR